MFDRIHNALQETDSIESLEGNRNSPTDGVIYFRLQTDDQVAPQLKYFQPENSTIVVENGDIVEFDVRLGKWSPSDQETTMTAIREAARTAARQTCVYLSRIDSGGGGGFVPHVRCWEGPVPVTPFLTFLDALVMEVEFLQTHTSTPTAASG